MKFNIHTFGCKVNLYESEFLRESLEKMSFEWTDSLSDCDVAIVNSCTVTKSGDSRVNAYLRKIRREAPDAISVLTGCLPQAKLTGLEILDADIICGTKNRRNTGNLINKYMFERHKIIDVEDYSSADAFEPMECTQISDHTRAFVKIQDGCNQFCSYCTIPFARGRCRSKKPEDLKNEFENIAKNGYKEVVLSGINLAFWGMEWNMHLRDAVKLAADTDGIERIRLSSLEPERITDSDLEYFSKEKKFCPQFHLSLQSGCDNTLRAMNRKYTSAEYFDLVSKIRRLFDHPAVTTDIMVGFPGETDEDFKSSLDFVKKCGFARVHVFKYSRRPGTKADKAPNQIPENIKTQRHKIMQDEVTGLSMEFNKSMIGATFPVLFERQKEAEYFNGHAPNGTVIKISSKNSEKDLRNLIFYVTIDKSSESCCYGSIADK